MNRRLKLPTYLRPRSLHGARKTITDQIIHISIYSNWYWHRKAGIKEEWSLHQKSGGGWRKDEARPLVLCVPFSVLTPMTGQQKDIRPAKTPFHYFQEALFYSSKGKEKERKSIYIAPFCTKVHTKHSGMDHTVLPANNTMPAFPSCAFSICHHHSNCGSRHPIAAHYSFIDPKRTKGWVGLVGWPIADGLPT